MPLSQGRQTKTRPDGKVHAPLEANTTVYAGGLVALNAAGNVVAGQTATGLKSTGVAQSTVTNTGAAGDEHVEYDSSALALFKNSSGADEITRADIGNDCFIVDDETLAKTNGGGTRSRAGQIADVDSGGVWLRFV